MTVVILAHDAKADAKDLVVDFLRRQADEIETGKRSAHAAVLVFYEDRQGSMFKTATCKCNLDLLQEIGVLYCALNDVTRAE